MQRSDESWCAQLGMVVSGALQQARGSARCVEHVRAASSCSLRLRAYTAFVDWRASPSVHRLNEPTSWFVVAWKHRLRGDTGALERAHTDDLSTRGPATSGRLASAYTHRLRGLHILRVLHSPRFVHVTHMCALASLHPLQRAPLPPRRPSRSSSALRASDHTRTSPPPKRYRLERERGRSGAGGENVRGADTGSRASDPPRASRRLSALLTTHLCWPSTTHAL